MGDTILAAILRRQNRPRFSSRDFNPRIGQHPQPLIKPGHLLTDNPILFDHQLHAAKIARRHVVVVNAAGDTPFHLSHQRQHARLVQRLAAELVHGHQRSDHRAGAGTQPGANRHVFFQRHRHRHRLADLPAKAFPALVNNVLLRRRRQFAGEASKILQAKLLRRFDSDVVAKQRAIDRRDRRAQHIKPDAHIGTGSRGIYFDHLKLLTSRTGCAAGRRIRRPP